MAFVFVASVLQVFEEVFDGVGVESEDVIGPPYLLRFFACGPRCRPAGAVAGPVASACTGHSAKMLKNLTS